MKRILSYILILGLLLSLLPGAVLAAPAETIDEVVIRGLEAPREGMWAANVSSETLSAPQGAGYYLPRQTAYWKNGKDQTIYPGDYAFEAGGTYKLSLNIGAADYSKVFSDKPEVVLEGVPTGSYSVEVEPMVGNSYIMVTVTFVLPGTFQPEPISAIHLLGGEIKDGVRVDEAPIMLYNHGYVGNATWDGELTPRREFIGGNTYNLVFCVYDYNDVGVAPLEDIVVTYNRQTLDAVVEFFDDEVIHVSAWVTVPEIKTVSSVLTYGFSTRYPIEGANAKSYAPWEDLTWPDNKGYCIREVSSWFRASNNVELSEEAQFVLGEKYYLNVTYRLEDTFNSKFSDAPTFTLHGVPEEYYTVSIISQTYNEITVRYTFTARKPPAEIISRVNVWDIDTPRPNVKADYGALTYDGGYRISRVEWYNKTGNHYLYIPNHDQYQGNEYDVEVYLEALDGYEFDEPADLKGYINGTQASVVARLSDTTCKLEYHFGPCQPGTIDQFKVWSLMPPETGAVPDYYGETGDHYYLNKDDAYFDNGIGWFDLTEGLYIAPSDTFLAGHQYQVELYLSPDVGYTFAEGTATVDGETPEGMFVSDDVVILHRVYPACKVDGKFTITQLELLGVNAPVAGGTPGYSAGIVGDGYELEDLNSENYLNGICWFDKTLGREMSLSEPFQAGHEYQVICRLVTQEGYAFGPDPAATVNGETVDDIICSEDVCMLRYSFGICKPVGKEITSVDYVSVDAPVAGELPDYFVTEKGEGYSNKNWNTQYMHNGVRWYDITAQCDLTPDDPFRAGHQYQVYVLTVAEAGYYFADDITGTINGNPVEIFRENGEMNLCYIFPPLAGGQIENPFTDVPENSWYKDAVLWAVQAGVTSGTGNGTTFSPDRECSRAEVVTFLWRTAGAPEPGATEVQFTDVASGIWYDKAVRWAVEMGITKGTGDGSTFSPDKKCSRAEVVTFLMRFAGDSAVRTENPFADVPAGAWFEEAVLWAAANNITKGTGDGTAFSPNKICSRAEVVTFLYRCMNP